MVRLLIHIFLDQDPQISCFLQWKPMYCKKLKKIDGLWNSNFVFIDGTLIDEEMTQIIYHPF